MREPLSRIVWLTETKIRRRYFFIPRPLRRRHGWIPCVPARTKDKRRRRLSFVSSVICLADRWRWAAVAGRRAPAFPETFSTERRERMRRYGVAWLERPHLNATGKGLSALSSLLCRATYARPANTPEPRWDLKLSIQRPDPGNVAPRNFYRREKVNVVLLSR